MMLARKRRWPIRVRAPEKGVAVPTRKEEFGRVWNGKIGEH
jgi:hypothetical protein